MLTHFSIRGFAVVDSLAVELSSGFNVITGETGSGKSVLVRALNFLLGSKTSGDVIRKGCDESTVTGQFIVESNHFAVRTAEKLGLGHLIEVADNGECQFILRRSLSLKGRSQCYINDAAVSVGTLKTIGSALIDVFGQHDHHRLLDPDLHIDFVDNFGQTGNLRAAVLSDFEHCQELLSALGASVDTFHARRKDQDYLKFRHDEWQQFAPTEADYKSIVETCEGSKDNLQVRDTLKSAFECLDQRESGGSLSAPLWEVSKILRRLPGDSSSPLSAVVTEIASRIPDLAGQVDTLSWDLTKAIESLEVDDSELERRENRLAGYQGLIRKFGVQSIEELMTAGEALHRDFELLSSVDFVLQEKLRTLLKASMALAKSSGALAVRRKKAADDMQQRVASELKQLSMPNARLTTELQPVTRHYHGSSLAGFSEEIDALWSQCWSILERTSAKGAETAVFYLSANKGELQLPLHKMASGGELSRIMLALKSISASELEPTVLVFDEIDTGISGKVADVLGRKLRNLSAEFQVICISHLPQVAAYGEAHFSVKKSETKSRTSSAMTRLSPDDRAGELAKLLSGEEITEHSLANARALLNHAQEKGRGAASH